MDHVAILQSIGLSPQESHSAPVILDEDDDIFIPSQKIHRSPSPLPPKQICHSPSPFPSQQIHHSPSPLPPKQIYNSPSELELNTQYPTITQTEMNQLVLLHEAVNKSSDKIRVIPSLNHQYSYSAPSLHPKHKYHKKKHNNNNNNNNHNNNNPFANTLKHSKYKKYKSTHRKHSEYNSKHSKQTLKTQLESISDTQMFGGPKPYFIKRIPTPTLNANISPQQSIDTFDYNQCFISDSISISNKQNKKNKNHKNNKYKSKYQRNENRKSINSKYSNSNRCNYKPKNTQSVSIISKQYKTKIKKPFKRIKYQSTDGYNNCYVMEYTNGNNNQYGQLKIGHHRFDTV